MVDKDLFNMVKTSTNREKELLLRQLYTLIASEMQKTFTFKEIAEWFYNYGIIEIPEDPYPDYDGSKYDYVLEKILNAKDNTNFLVKMVPELFFDLKYIKVGGETSRMEYLLKQIGYRIVLYKKDGLFYVSPPKNLKGFVKKNKQTKKIINVSNLPREIADLVRELNDNTSKPNVYACALLSRKIITMAVYISLNKISKGHLLKNKLGDDLELNKMLNVAKQELKISDQIMSRVKASKWIGDSANHSYKVQINENDIHTCIIGLRLFLEELFN